VTTTPFLARYPYPDHRLPQLCQSHRAIATTRAREIGMRKVLGASQPHLMRQYLVEAGLLGESH